MGYRAKKKPKPTKKEIKNKHKTSTKKQELVG